MVVDEVAPALEVDGLRARIRQRQGVVRVLDGVSFVLRRGETLGIVGESGSGKSMTALSIMRLLPPGGEVDQGRVLLGGTDLLDLRPKPMASLRGDRVAMVFQDPLTSLNPTMDVGSQVAEAIRLHRSVSKVEALRQAVDMLDLVGVPGAKSRSREFPHQFSGGMRQRVAIAMALVCEPEVLIADEPTTALDVTTQHQILELFDDLRRRFSMALILITHDLAVVAGRADRVAVMYAGKVVEEAAAADLFDSPRHRYTEALLQATPIGSRRQRGRLTNIPGLPPDLGDLPGGCSFHPRCEHSTDRCASEEPVLELKGEHRFACFHPATTSRVPIPATSKPLGVEDGAAVGEVIFSCSDIVKDFAAAEGLLQRANRRRVSAVAGVSLEVRESETFGLVGESGCGKSTLSRILVALDTPTSGNVRLRGQDLTTLRRKELRLARRNLQLAFQDAAASLNPRMSVGTILAEPLRLQHIGTRRTRGAMVRELLDDVGLPASSVERYPHEFSGGQRQRIALARALALKPDVIVADEPVSALDVSVQAQILNLMSALQREYHLAYVFVSHDLAVVRYLADRIGVMYLGKLVEVGPSEQIYRRPRHPYTKTLIDATPALRAPGGRQARSRLEVRGELPSAVDPPSGCRFRDRCPRAQDRCAEVEPPLRTIDDPTHELACHFPLEPSLGEPGTDVTAQPG